MAVRLWLDRFSRHGKKKSGLKDVHHSQGGLRVAVLRCGKGPFVAGNARFVMANISEHCTRNNDPLRTFALSVRKLELMIYEQTRHSLISIMRIYANFIPEKPHFSKQAPSKRFLNTGCHINNQ